jgi:hypothetical protein
MVNKPLAAFIKDNVNKGYTIFSVRQHLLEQGYSDAEINEAIDYAYNPVQKHEIHFSRAAIALILVLAFLLAATAYFVFYYQQQPAQLLDVSIIARSEKNVKPGSQFTFQYELSNTGSKKRYDVLMTFELVEKESGAIVESFEKTVAVQTSISSIESISIPTDAKLGQYFARATAKYRNQEAKSSISINVIQESAVATCTDGIKNQNEEGIDCGGPCKKCETCTDSIKNQNEEDMDCGGVCPPCRTGATTPTTPITETTQPEEEQKPSWEILADIHEKAMADPEAAAKECLKQKPDVKDKCLVDIVDITSNKDYCIDISLTSRKDSCILIAAQKNSQSEYCREIISDSVRDQCYMNFILNTQNPQFFCEELVNPSLKRACEGLKMARSASAV